MQDNNGNRKKDILDNKDNRDKEKEKNNLISMSDNIDKNLELLSKRVDQVDHKEQISLKNPLNKILLRMLKMFKILKMHHHKLKKKKLKMQMYLIYKFRMYKTSLLDQEED